MARRYARKLPVLLQRMLPKARDAPWGRRRDQLRMMQFPLRHRLRVVNRRCHGKRPRQKRQKLKEVRIKVQLHPRSPGHQRQQSHQHQQQCRQRLKFPKQILPEQKQNPRGQKSRSARCLKPFQWPYWRCRRQPVDLSPLPRNVVPKVRDAPGARARHQLETTLQHFPLQLERHQLLRMAPNDSCRGRKQRQRQKQRKQKQQKHQHQQ